MIDKKNTEAGAVELSEEELDDAHGAGIKAGPTARGKKAFKAGLDPLQMERVHEDE